MAFTSFPDENEILHVGGQLYYNPTNLATESGWGTMIGYTVKENASYSINFETVEITSEDSGTYPIQSIFIGCKAILYANITSWNATVCKLLFPSLSGGTSGTLITIPGSLKTGTDNFTSDKILFVPEDSTRHPALYFKNIAPQLIKSSVVKYMHSDQTIFPFACLAKDFQQGKLSEIIL